MSWLGLIESVGEEPAGGERDTTACPVCNCAAFTVVGEGLVVATEGPVAGNERLEAGIGLVEGVAMSGPTGGGGVIALFPWVSPLLAFRRLNLRSRFMLAAQWLREIKASKV